MAYRSQVGELNPRGELYEDERKEQSVNTARAQDTSFVAIPTPAKSRKRKGRNSPLRQSDGEDGTYDPNVNDEDNDDDYQPEGINLGNADDDKDMDGVTDDDPLERRGRYSRLESKIREISEMVRTQLETY